jgi:hypothetical protein
VSETASEPAETGQTPDAPDVDQPEGGQGASGKTPSNPEADQPDGGTDS